MNPRLRKEFRGLLVPLVITLAPTVLMPIWLLSGNALCHLVHGWVIELLQQWVIPLTGFLGGLAPVVFFGGIVAMAGGTFGVEFQHRTSALWLSQPASRASLWKDKMLALMTSLIISGMVAVLGLLLLQWRFFHFEFADDSAKEGWLLGALGAGLFFLTTACSACYWTLLARSTLGGIVFSVGSQFALVVGVYFGSEKLFGDTERLKVGAIGVVGLLYAITFLFLGWRKFVSYEIRDSTPGQGSFQLGSLPGLVSVRWLAYAPRSNFVNLLRKELGLGLPLFVLAAVFVGCWLISRGALWLLPGHRESFVVVFGVLFAVYLSVMAVLSGAMSVIEEKNLGTHAWQLTVPLAGWKLWLMKLATACCLGLILGLLLPALLWLCTAPALSVDTSGIQQSGNWDGILIAWVSCFALSFWGATLTNNSAQAALTAVLGLGWISLCVYLGTFCAEGIAGPEGEFAGWLHLLRLGALARSLSPLLAFILFVGPALSTVVLQSLFQFRRIQTGPRVFLKYGAVLGVVVFLTAFFSAG